ncbi:xanthine-guanine phosphoribosyltransferase [mine drainage metagenome]|uniref:Xanthine-guanine phosphoribosyltransferase n=1 Tax=mine drainage metagenome TaxID=410659 RepID=T1C3G7_9ZZZZ
MEFRARIVKWDEIEDWCRNISDSLIKGQIPDAIIGMSRGGLVPARIVSDRLLIKELYAIKTEHWGLTATIDGTATLKQGLSSNIKGMNVLIVDDITDTGQSMKLAYDYIKSQSPGSVRTAAMLHITHSVFKPDYFAREINDSQWTWFIFPWNVFEDVMNLSGKIINHEMEVAEIKEGLFKAYELEITEEKLSEVLIYMENLGKIRKNPNNSFNPIMQS